MRHHCCVSYGFPIELWVFSIQNPNNSTNQGDVNGIEMASSDFIGDIMKSPADIDWKNEIDFQPYLADITYLRGIINELI